MTTANGKIRVPAPLSYEEKEGLVFNSLMSAYLRMGGNLADNGVMANDTATLWGERLAAVRSGNQSVLEANANRDLDRECGYEKWPTITHFQAAYDRIGIANRYVNIWPDECWAVPPQIYEDEDPDVSTAFEKGWDAIERKFLPWHYLHRADRLSRIGHYGILLLGLADGRKLDQPVAALRRDGSRRKNASEKLKLVYLRPYGESSVKVLELDDDPASPRYGQPTYYQLSTFQPSSEGPAQSSRRIHWHRAVHLAPNRGSSEVHGTPCLKAVLNDVYDIRKVGGSSAEMFYKGGFPGYSFTTFPDLAGTATINKDAVRQEVLAYQNGLQRFLSAVGGEWKSLAVQVADPSKHLMQKVAMLCATGGFPVRIFMGSESGHLASSQDASNWKERVAAHRTDYEEPFVVRPLVDRLVAVGAVPPPAAGRDYTAYWPDLKTLGEKDRTDVALKKVQALMQYVGGGVFALMPPRLLYTLVLNFTDQEAAAIIKVQGGEKKVMAELRKMAAQVQAKVPGEKQSLTAAGGGVGKSQSGGRAGKPPKKPAGRPPGRLDKKVNA